MNDGQLEVIYDLQHLLGISYQEAYKIVDEYLYYGDVDLSDFEDDLTINVLTPIHKNIILNIMNNVQTVPLLHTYDKEIMLNIKNNQENISKLFPREQEILLNILNNKQESISYLKPREHELLVQIQDNKRDINTLSARDKEVLLNIMNKQDNISYLTARDKEVLLNIMNNNTKIDLLTAKSSEIDLDVSKSDNDSVQLLNTLDKELSIDIDFGLPNTPSHVDLDNIYPLSINSISSIHEYEPNVNSLDILSLNNVRTIKEIELEELKPLSLGKLPNISDIGNNTIDYLSLGKLPNIHELNMNEIDTLSLNDIRDIPSINLSNIDELSINDVLNIPNIDDLSNIELLDIGELPSIQELNMNTVDSLSLGKLPSITPFDIDTIDILQLSKLDDFKWGRINARVKRNDLPLLFMNNIREVPTVEHSDIEELTLYDVPQLSDFNVSKLEELTFEQLNLDDNLDILNEITKREVLPPVTIEDFIKAGADPDTVDMYFNDYLSTSESYNLETIRLFFKHALTEKDRAIEAGGNYKGLYKIVTEERGTFLSFITELYMTELCQYDEDVGTVIIRYHSMIDGFLINEAHYYNSLI